MAPACIWSLNLCTVNIIGLGPGDNFAVLGTTRPGFQRNLHTKPDCVCFTGKPASEGLKSSPDCVPLKHWAGFKSACSVAQTQGLQCHSLLYLIKVGPHGARGGEGGERLTGLWLVFGWAGKAFSIFEPAFSLSSLCWSELCLPAQMPFLEFFWALHNDHFPSASNGADHGFCPFRLC